MFFGGLGFTNTVLGSSRALCYRTGPRPTKGRTDAARRGTERERRGAPQKDQPRAIPRGHMGPPGQWASSGPKVKGPVDPRSVGQRAQGQWASEGPKVDGPAGPRSLGQRGVQGHGASEGPNDTGGQRGVQGHWPEGPRTRGQRGVQGHGASGPKDTGPARPTGPLGPGHWASRGTRVCTKSSVTCTAHCLAQSHRTTPLTYNVPSDVLAGPARRRRRN